MGCVYVSPHYSTLNLQERLQDHLSLLPGTTLPCVITGDTNAPLTWNASRKGVDAKGRVLVDMLSAHGFDLVAPGEEQLLQPTSKPRRPGASGRRIDWVAAKRAPVSRVHIHTDFYGELGTDHDALSVALFAPRARLREPRVRLGVRVVQSPLLLHGLITQEELVRLARCHTGPKKRETYQGSTVVKELFVKARSTEI